MAPLPSGYTEVATVHSFEELATIQSSYHLQNGDRVLVAMEMSSWYANLMNLSGAELVFQNQMPDHMNLIDVYGEGNYGYVVMQATSPPLVAVIGALGPWGVLAVFAGTAILLSAIVISITIAVKLAQTEPGTVTSLFFGAMVITIVALGGYYLYTHRSVRPREVKSSA